jgi:hypothetical protein
VKNFFHICPTIEDLGLTLNRCIPFFELSNDNQEPRSFYSEPLTDNDGHSEQCLNPFCQGEMKARSGKKFCSDRCRMDGYVLRRAREMIDRVGIVNGARAVLNPRA